MIVGIDLGTTNSAMAYINANGKPEIIPNSEGGRTTPSVIQFKKNATVIVGEEAKTNAILDPFNVIEFIKSEMGNQKYKFIKDGFTYSAEELTGLILRKLKKDAEQALNTTIEKAVVTVPAYFSDAQRKATQDAGKLIGLDIIKIINEPTAAALAYGLLNNSEPQNVLVYDLGGGTFDATIVSIADKEVVVRATDGIRELGGRDFDDKIIEYAVSIFKAKHGIDLEDIDNAKELQELRRQVERLKKTLSIKLEAELYVSCRGLKETIKLSRSKFYEMIRPLYKRTLRVIEDALRDANIGVQDIDKILLVGGSTRIPLIAEGLQQVFGIAPSTEVNPDEIVALGAAIQGNILAGDFKEVNEQVKVVDVSSHSIGVISVDANSGEKINTIILNRNTSLPAKGKRIFYTIEDNQEVLKLQITEGELEEVQYVTIIGTFEIQLPPGLKKETPVEIEINLDDNQIIHIFMRIPQVTDFYEEVYITRNSNLRPEELAKKKDIVSKIEVENKGLPTDLPMELKPLEKFIGMQELKHQVLQITNMIQFEKRRRQKLGIEGEFNKGSHLVITGNPGTGKTSIARALAEVFNNIGLTKEEKLIEVDRKALVGQYIGETEKKTKAKIEEAMGGILFIDEAYALYKPDNPRDFGKDAIEVLMKEMEDRRSEFVVIAAGYKKQMDVFFESNPGLRDRFNYRIHIPDYSNQELIAIAEKIAYEQYYLLSDEGKKALLERIERERVEENFSNARFVRKVVEEAIQNFANRMVQGGTDISSKDQLITLEAIDITGVPMKSPEEEIEAALQELYNLVGLEQVKDQVNSVINQIQVAQQRKKMGLKCIQPSLHMLFIGNPGTGKTTVAKILGRVYKALGVLKNGDRFLECTRGDFVSNHVGETALKTQKVIRSALGGILFIDEAYALYQGDNDTFGKEAIDVLIKEMEDKRNNLMVIMAGYQQEMKMLLSSNPGFESRINTTITFEDYTTDQLLDIFKKMCTSYDMTIDEMALDELDKYIKDLYLLKKQGFGNGREVRNIFERIIKAQNNRIAKILSQGIPLSKQSLMQIEVEDVLSLK